MKKKQTTHDLSRLVVRSTLINRLFSNWSYISNNSHIFNIYRQVYNSSRAPEKGLRMVFNFRIRIPAEKTYSSMYSLTFT